MILSRQISKAIEIIERIHKKQGVYIHFDVTLSSIPPIKFNIYTPILNHNSFTDYDKLMEFLLSIEAEDNKKFKLKQLNNDLESCRRSVDVYTENVDDILRDIERLEKDGN